MSAAESCGADPARAIDFGLATEFIHAYSLVHDDLPSMDDDDLRRGRPTSHRQYGEATAILVGDALQAAAFGRLARATEHGVSDAAVVEAVAVLSGAAGWGGMVGGQYMDIAHRTDAEDRGALRELHNRKTGALIAAAVQLGAIVGGVHGTALESWHEMGIELGWLFQLVDDLLDVVGDEANTGRPTGSDQRKQRLTAAVVFGGEHGLSQECDAQLVRCLEVASGLPGGGGRLPAIATFIRHRDR
jgi:geranylgeranyl pyrophosphate synthase